MDALDRPYNHGKKEEESGNKRRERRIKEKEKEKKKEKKKREKKKNRKHILSAVESRQKQLASGGRNLPMKASGAKKRDVQLRGTPVFSHPSVAKLNLTILRPTNYADSIF
jgi:hypothetical protein